MKRLLILIIIIFLGLSCGKSEEETETQKPGLRARAQERGTAASRGREMIPLEKEAPPTIEDTISIAAAIKPYFDEMGTITEKSVSPGESFDVYVIAEYDEDVLMSAAEYRLILPAGVTINEAEETDSVLFRTGFPERDFVIAFRCTPGPRMILVKYLCKAQDNFAGGTVATEPGGDLSSIQCATCDFKPIVVNAEKGSAILKKK